MCRSKPRGRGVPQSREGFYIKRDAHERAICYSEICPLRMHPPNTALAQLSTVSLGFVSSALHWQLSSRGSSALSVAQLCSGSSARLSSRAQLSGTAVAQLSRGREGSALRAAAELWGDYYVLVLGVVPGSLRHPGSRRPVVRYMTSSYSRPTRHESRMPQARRRLCTVSCMPVVTSTRESPRPCCALDSRQAPRPARAVRAAALLWC